jgi:hypothetical protein
MSSAADSDEGQALRRESGATPLRPQDQAASGVVRRGVSNPHSATLTVPVPGQG